MAISLSDTEGGTVPNGLMLVLTEIKCTHNSPADARNINKQYTRQSAPAAGAATDIRKLINDF